MTVEYQDPEALLERIKLLPPEYRLRLIHDILETLIPARPSEKKGAILQFGEYRQYDGPLSIYEDYAIAEWRPSERELNGE